MPIATGNIGMIIPYSHHGNTIFKVMLLPQQYLFLCIISLCNFTNVPGKHILTPAYILGEILDSENLGKFDE